MVKTINSISLKLIDGVEWSRMVLIFFDIIIESRSADNYTKLIGLAIKCILKSAKNIEHHKSTL